MLALYIILGILLFLFLLTLLDIVICFSYENEPRLTARIAFVKLRLVPQKPKKKKKAKNDKPKKKKTEKKEPEKPKEKKPSALKKMYGEKGLTGILNIVQSLAELAVGTLKDICAATRVRRLNFSIRVAGKDAADTAVKYGMVCSGVFPALSVIMSAVRVRRRSVRVEPDFSDNPSTEIKVDTVIRIRIIRILKIAIVRAVQALKLYFHKIK